MTTPFRADPAVLRSVLETAHDAFVAADVEGCIVDWNRAAEATFGWAREEVLGQPLRDVIIPERYREAHVAGLHRVATGGAPRVLNQPMQVHASHKDGHEIPVDLTIWRVETDAGTTFCAFLRDVSERLRAQRAVELLHATTLAANRAGSLEEAYPDTLAAVCAFTGWPVGHVYEWEPREGMLLPTSHWHGDPAQFAAFRAVTAETILAPGEGLPGRVYETGRPVWVQDVTVAQGFPRPRLRPDLGVRGAFAFPILTGDQVVAVLEFFSPLPQAPDPEILDFMAQVGTQLGRVEERRRALVQLEVSDELRRSNEDLEAFAYAVSHDLQEPLRTVQSFLDLLERRHGERLDAEAREFVGLALGGARRMRELIAALLEYARIDTRGRPLQPTDAGEVLREALEDLALALDEAGATVEAEELPTVRVDRAQLRQVFQNLVGNALKFSGDAPARIRVTSSREGPCWRIAVSDEGPGIEASQHERIFQIFRRAAPEGVPGTGLGLALCRRIVQRHGGEITVDSEPGHGATFSFTLPAFLP